jgi:hypothetical protein
MNLLFLPGHGNASFLESVQISALIYIIHPYSNSVNLLQNKTEISTLGFWLVLNEYEGLPSSKLINSEGIKVLLRRFLIPEESRFSYNSRE